MQPILHCFGLDLAAFGVMCALGIIAALALSLFRARRASLRLDAAFVLFVAALAAGFIGAMMLYGWVTYGLTGPLDMLLGRAEIGFVFYGGLLFGLPAALGAIRLLKLPVLPCLNAFAPALPLGHALGRVGCFLAGCCYGIKTRLPLGVIYPPGHVTDGARVLPVPLMEAALLLLLTAWLLADSRRHPRRTARMYVTLYAVMRFLMEFLRGDVVRGMFLGLSTSQWVSVILLICINIFKKKRFIP